MKKYLFMLVAVFAMSTAAFAQKGVTGFGVQGVYDDWNGQFGIGVKLQFGLVDQLRADVATDLFFKKKADMLMTLMIGVVKLIKVLHIQLTIVIEKIRGFLNEA